MKPMVWLLVPIVMIPMASSSSIPSSQQPSAAGVVVMKATDIATYHDELAKQLVAASGTDRPDYVTGAIGGASPLLESEDRAHFFSVVHRSGFSWAEEHDDIADVYVVVDGSGTLVLGGEMIEPVRIEGRPGESRAPRLEGGSRYEVDKGDLINIPERVPHQWDLADGESITYIIVKVRQEV